MDPTFSYAEIVRLAGGYKRPGDQLAELHRQGFWRARRSRLTGAVILERPHYEAVSQGLDAKPAESGPKLRRPTPRKPALA